MHFMTYVKHAYEIVLEGEYKAGVTLDHETEAYVVQLLAKYIDKPSFNDKPVAVKMLTSLQMPNDKRKEVIKDVADECLLINGFELGKRKWPTENYYVDMGRLAYSNVAYIERPPEMFYEDLAKKFTLISKVIRKTKQ